MAIVQLFSVIIPAKYSRQFQVPEYDIPVLETLWPAGLRLPDREIEIQPMGIVVERDADAEYARIVEAYKAPTPEAPDIPAWRSTYPSVHTFRRACDRAVEATRRDLPRAVAAIERERQGMTMAQAAGEGVDSLEVDLDAPGAPAPTGRRKRVVRA